MLFTVDIPASAFVAGANTITATALDAQANNTSATVTITTKCQVPKVVGKTLGKARAALRAHWCGFKRAVPVASTLRRGRVVGTKPKKGAIRPANTKIIVYISKG